MSLNSARRWSCTCTLLARPCVIRAITHPAPTPGRAVGAFTQRKRGLFDATAFSFVVPHAHRPIMSGSVGIALQPPYSRPPVNCLVAFFLCLETCNSCCAVHSCRQFQSGRAEHCTTLSIKHLEIQRFQQLLFTQYTIDPIYFKYNGAS